MFMKHKSQNFETQFNNFLNYLLFRPVLENANEVKNIYWLSTKNTTAKFGLPNLLM